MTKFLPFSSYKNKLPDFNCLQITQDSENFEIEKTFIIKYSLGFEFTLGYSRS